MAAPTNVNMRRDEEYADEWFFASVKLYDQLHMYSVQHPTAAMCWTRPDRACVIGKMSSGKSEILDLSLPSRLLAAEQALVKDRDFDVCSGTFYDKQISSVCRVSEKNFGAQDRLMNHEAKLSRGKKSSEPVLPQLHQNDGKVMCVVTSEKGSNQIQVWTLGDENTGLIKPIQTVQSEESESASPVLLTIRQMEDPAHHLLYGSLLSNLCLLDLNTQQPMYKTQDLPSERMSRVVFIDDNSFLACSVTSGDIWIGDVRECPSKMNHHPWCVDESAAIHSWACDVLSQGVGSARQGKLVRMSNKGDVFISESSTPGNFTKRGTVSERLPSHLQLQLCVTNPSLLSTTDARGNVLIYNTDSWTDSAVDVEECFKHEGHWVNSETGQAGIQCHMWHQTHKELVMSAASDGSLHAWVPNLNR